MRKHYPGLTIFKVVGSLLVLLGHVRVPDLYAQYGRIPGLQQATAFVVPCFYISAGFLACKGWLRASRPQAYVHRYVSWLAGLYVGLCLLALATGTGLAVPAYAPGAWHNGVLPLAKRYLVEPPYPSLWFIPPLLLGVMGYYYCQRWGLLRWACLLTFIGFLGAQLLSGTLRAVAEAETGPLFFVHWRYVDLLIQTGINYGGLAFPCILAGVLIARREAAFLAWPVGWLSAGTLVCLTLEYELLQTVTQQAFTHKLIFSMLPLGIWLFYGLLHVRSSFFTRHHALLSQYSALLYFLHPVLLLASTALLRLVGIPVTTVYGGLSLLIHGQPATASLALAVMLLVVVEVGAVQWALNWLTTRRVPAVPMEAMPETVEPALNRVML